MGRKLPLLPIKTVLFPGAEMVLRLFDARDLKMLHDCLRTTHKTFGLVYCSDMADEEANMAKVGCTAHIIECTPYEDGTYIARIEGGERFKVRNPQLGDKDYWLADIEPISENADLSLDDPAHESLYTLLEIYRELLFDMDPELVYEDKENADIDLTFFAFRQLMIADKVRQQALEITDYEARMELALELLRKEIETLKFLLSDVEEGAALSRMN